MTTAPTSTAAPAAAPRTIAILAGGGQLPTLCAQAAIAAGDTVMAITFNGQPQPEDLPPEVNTFPQSLGAIGQALKTMRQNNVTHVLMAGNLTKASLFTLKPDVRGLKFLASHALWHDDALLSSLAQLFAAEGFTILSVPQVAPNLMAAAGTLTHISPTQKHLQDITQGMAMLNHLATLDVGQALIIKQGVVLGIEAIEGTNALITRCAALRGEANSGGILVKAAKQQQTDQADLPTIGPKTIALLAQHGYAGLAIQAGRTIILDQDATIAAANQHKLFLCATPAASTAAPQ